MAFSVPRGCHIFFGICFAVFFTLAIYPSVACANSKYASFVIDADTGQILHQRHADKMLHPASLTKVMTLIMVFDALDSGKLHLDDKIRVSRTAASMVPSKLHLPVGSHIKVRDAIYALVTKSANDVAVAIAEKLARTESRFALKMTEKAREIGMTRTRFMNASGLHHPKQVSTARDMATMGRYLISLKSRHYGYFKRQHFKYRGKSYRNHNRLLAEYDGMDGIKTGYIQAAGFNLLASAKRGNKRVIAVVFGGRTSKSRNRHMKTLLDKGFAELEKVRFAEAPLPVRNPRRGVVAPEEIVSLEPSNGTIVSVSASELTRNLLSAPPQNILDIPDQEIPVPDSAKAQKWLEEQQVVIPKISRQTIAAIMRRQHRQVLQNSPQVKTQQTSQKSALTKNNVSPVNNQAATTQTLGTLKMRGLQNASVSAQTQGMQKSEWSIQIGAFSERSRTDRLLNEAVMKLPVALRYAAPRVAPIQGSQGWIYRAWLSGFNYEDARRACLYYKECLVLSPENYTF